MSATSAIAQAIAAAVAPLVAQYEALATSIRENDAKHKAETVKVSDLTYAMEKSSDADVMAARERLIAAQEQITALQATCRAERNIAQGILYPNTVVQDTLSDEDRKALITSASTLRKQIVETYKSAQAVDPDFVPAELSPVVGTRGRKAGFVSASKGKPKPRVSVITLDGNTLDKATFGTLQKKIFDTTGVKVSNEVISESFFTALGSEDWQSDANKGKTVSFSLVVNEESGREVSISVTV